MSSFYRAKSDLAQALKDHPQAAALLHNLDVAVSVERKEAFVDGQCEAAKPRELPGNPTELRDQLEFLWLSGCNVMIHIGRAGIACSITDPDRVEPVHRASRKPVPDAGIEEAVDKAFQAWETTRPQVAA